MHNHLKESLEEDQLDGHFLCNINNKQPSLSAAHALTQASVLLEYHISSRPFFLRPYGSCWEVTTPSQQPPSGGWDLWGFLVNTTSLRVEPYKFVGELPRKSRYYPWSVPACGPLRAECWSLWVVLEARYGMPESNVMCVMGRMWVIKIPSQT